VIWSYVKNTLTYSSTTLKSYVKSPHGPDKSLITGPMRSFIKQKNVKIAFYNLIFTHANSQCQQLLLECNKCALLGMKTLKRHFAPMTEDHTDKMDGLFRSIQQPYNEIATSYFQRLRALRRDCHHAGIHIKKISYSNAQPKARAHTLSTIQPTKAKNAELMTLV
jgi:hypothetical protein